MKVQVKYEIEIPDTAATEDQVIEWLRFSLHDNGSMQMSNPLAKAGDVEPVFPSLEIIDADTRRVLY
jgi:hypothetical protein